MCDAAGTDIVSVARIEALLSRSGDRFIGRWFTPAEATYCMAKAFPSRHLAARLAAKEAVVKAMRVEPGGPVVWWSVEVVTDSRGAPGIRLHAPLEGLARREGIRSIEVSMSHCVEYATAIAIVSKAQESGGSGANDGTEGEGCA